MSFGYQSSIRKLPTIYNYSEALQCWKFAGVWRDNPGESAPRALVGRRNKHYAVRKNADQSIAFSLYGTDVVTIFPDSHLELRLTSWSTAMTAAFFHGLLFATSMQYYFSAECLKIGSRWYRLQGGVTKVGPCVRGEREMLSETQEFTSYKMGRKAWNAVISHYKLRQLASTLIAFGDAVGVEICAENFESICKEVTMLPESVVALTAAWTGYYTRPIVQAFSWQPSVSDFVRQTIARVHTHLLIAHRKDVLVPTTKPYFTSELEFMSWRRSMGKWGD